MYEGLRQVHEFLDNAIDSKHTFRRHVDDNEKRLNILFDYLNNETVVKPDTIQELHQVLAHLQEGMRIQKPPEPKHKDAQREAAFDTAFQMVDNMKKSKLDEGGEKWVVSLHLCDANSRG